MTDLVRLEFSYRTGGAGYGASFRSTNVGFGLTHVLPVLVACLASKPGSLILIENPEAQLHPQGQVAIGKLLARVAAFGVQVIIETHSDHILNGIRLAVKNGELPPEKACFHFFTRTSKGNLERLSPIIDRNGLMSEWPSGFFTQWDDTLVELLS
jgi:predicted ATPase